MGQAAALRLLEQGHEVFAWNRSPGKTDEVVAAGATAPSDLADAIAPAEAVVTFLSNDDAVREMVLGDDGIAAQLGDRLYVDASTVSPAFSSELANAVDRFLALPIAGAPSTLRDGEAVCLPGGREELVEEAGPLIEALSSASHRYPRAELAAAAKIANNNLLLVGLAALAETVELGRAGGLSDAQLHELLDTSAMVPPGIRNRLQAVLDGDGPTWWTVELGLKDARLALELADDAADRVPVTAAAAAQYDSAADHGLGDADIAAITRLYSDPGQFT
jgi:3-hydroxyisobutyrate dehydrogenase